MLSHAGLSTSTRVCCRSFPAWKHGVRRSEAGENETGCTVHYVDLGMDTGPIIAQERVPVLPGDTAETLHARIQAAEHTLYPAVIARFAGRHSDHPA